MGKAANLKARLHSYTRSGWKEEMLREASSVSWEELSSDIEALIREAELIKKLKPRHNIWMRDDKNYFFVAFTKDIFPRIYLTHQPFGSRSSLKASPPKYIGPFTEGGPLKNVLSLLRRAFPYCTCPVHTLHRRPCVNAELGRCLGFCCLRAPTIKKNVQQYRSNITAIKKILMGKTRSLERELLKKMTKAATGRQYERARMYRDQVSALARIFAHSNYLKKDIVGERADALKLLRDTLHIKNIPERIECYDISHHQGDSSVASMVVFEHGMPAKNQYRKFIIKHVSGINDPAMIEEVITRRMKHTEWRLPDLVIVDGGKGQLNAAASALNTRVALASLAKREEKLYIVGKKNPLKLKTLQTPLLHLITAIRDEAHRFAITFHRKRRQKSLI